MNTMNMSNITICGIDRESPEGIDTFMNVVEKFLNDKNFSPKRYNNKGKISAEMYELKQKTKKAHNR